MNRALRSKPFVASPVKKRDPKKTSIKVHLKTRDIKLRNLQAELIKLSHRTPSPEPPTLEHTVLEDEWTDVDMKPVFEEDVVIVIPELPQRRTNPDHTTIKQYQRWTALLPDLQEGYLRYLVESTGVPLQSQPTLVQCCSFQRCSPKTANVLCLFLDYFKEITIPYCDCKSLPAVLVRNGLFPTAPHKPRMAIALVLLDFYQALFERACDAINAVASALHTFYERRGFYLTNQQGLSVKDAFRRGLSSAVQWHDCLQVKVRGHLDLGLEECLQRVEKTSLEIPQSFPPSSPLSSKLPCTTSSASVELPSTPGSPSLAQTLSPTATPKLSPSLGVSPASLSSHAEVVAEARLVSGDLQPGECDAILQNLCPACFGGKQYGRSFLEGGDIHVSTDGNRHHRHLSSAGKGPTFYNPKHFISKEFVDAVGDEIAIARKQKPKLVRRRVPDAAVDACEKSHFAAQDHQSGQDKFDDQGIMSLVCRHDIPLFFANIDTPGEEQKYAVALIKHLFSFLPKDANIIALYDIGCVLDRSLQLFDILPNSITSHLVLVTTAMHAYGHQWSCQLVYNPRLTKGLGLTDGEGVERIWSRLRGLIGIERRCGRPRRIWLLDRLIRFTSSEHRDDLGDWMHRRLHKGIKPQSKAACAVLKECGISESVLRDQWELQKASQLSIRAHTPARLKHELEEILTLQSEIDAIHKSIQKAKTAMQLSKQTKSSKNLITGLENTQVILKTQVDELYASLNIIGEFPELQGISLTFIRTLLLARDLKMTIRRKAVGSFFEWERLDRAVGGHHLPLGTKLHQTTRNGISKRKPALLQAIKKYNQYCDVLKKAAPPNCPIPIPTALPLELSALRDIETSGLMEDVWITPCEDSKLPLWLEDADVRNGIRAMLKVDRCQEEQRRLRIESENMCRWFGRRLTCLEVALRLPQYDSFKVLLQQQRYHLLTLKQRWTNPAASTEQFDWHISNALRVAEQLTGSAAPLIAVPLLSCTVAEQTQQEDEDDGVEDLGGDDADNLPTDSILLADLIQQPLLEEVQVLEEDDEEGLEEICSGPDKDSDDDVEIVAFRSQRRVAGTESFIKLQWERPASISSQPRFRDVMDSFARSFLPVQGSVYSNRVFWGHESLGLDRICLESGDLRRLQDPCQLLNDTCINGASTILHYNLLTSWETKSTASKCAVFSSYVMKYAEEGGSDDDIWRNTKGNLYWQRKVWLIPIHRPNSRHWVLCTIYPYEASIFFFDSCAGQETLTSLLPGLSYLIKALVHNAQRHGYSVLLPTDNWTAWPLITAPVQSNNYDCGVWVLSNIISVLHGFHVMRGLKEKDMPAIRQSILRSIYNMPSH